MHMRVRVHARTHTQVSVVVHVHLLPTLPGNQITTNGCPQLEAHITYVFVPTHSKNY